MSGRKRIAMYYNVGFGGGRRWLYEVVTRLDRYHDIDLFCISRSSSGAQYPDGTDLAQRTDVRTLRDLPRVPGKAGRVLNLPALYVDFIRFDRQARALAREIDERGYDLVFASVGDYTYAPLILRHLRTPSAYYCHEPMRTVYEPAVPRPYLRTPPALAPLRAAWRHVSAGYAGLRRAWDAQAARSASVVFVNSEYTREYARRAYGIESNVNHPGVDVEEFRPRGERPGNFVLSGPGTIIPSKGYDWAVRTIGAIPAERRPKLVIAGNDEDPRERRYLEAVAAACAVDLEVRVAVPDEELKRLLRTARLMLYTPHLEPFGLAPLEAMASGTPVVAVDEAGPHETVVDGLTGFLRERDPAALAEAVDVLLRDYGLRARMSAAARDRAVSRWTWDLAVGRLAPMLAEAAEQFRVQGASMDAGERASHVEATAARS